MAKKRKRRNKRSAEYWEERFSGVEELGYMIAREGLSEIEKQFRTAETTLTNQVLAWYQRFAANNGGMTMAEAKRRLSGKDLDEFKWDVQEYIRKGRENAVDQRWMQELENASARYHVSRLEAMKIRLRAQMEELAGKELSAVDKTLLQAYQETYYHSAFEIQKGVGVGWDFSVPDKRKIEQMLRKPWAPDGRDFSDRVWTNKEKLVHELETTLTQGVITGEDPQKTINKMSERLGVSKTAAGRLIMTEEAAAASRAQIDCFKELDVEEYEIVATLDDRTSEICQGMDGQHFKVDEYEIGVTAPPFHVNCRSTTVPYFDDDFDDPGERAARDEGGKTYYVPDDTTYEEWKNGVADSDKGRNAESAEKTSRSDVDYTERRKQRLAERSAKQETPSVDFDQMSLDELKRYANDQLQTEFVGMKGASAEYVREAVKVISKFEKEYGGTIDGLKVQFGGTPAATYAKYDDKTKTLHIKKTGSIEQFEKRLRDENTRFRVNWGTDQPYHATETFSGTIWHELGHAIDVESGQEYSAWLSSTTELDEASVKISAYAGSAQNVRVTKRSEAWAENFAAYMDGGEGKSRVPEEIAEKIRESLNGRDQTARSMASENDIKWPPKPEKDVKQKEADRKEIMSYAREKGIKLQGSKNFDGDPEMLKIHIGRAAELKSDFPQLFADRDDFLYIGGGNLRGSDLASTENHTIHLAPGMYRPGADVEGAMREIGAAVPRFDRLIDHELMHMLHEKYDFDELDIARRVLYNITGRYIDNQEELLLEVSKFVPGYATDQRYVSVIGGKKVIRFYDIPAEIYALYKDESPSQFIIEYMNEVFALVKGG